MAFPIRRDGGASVASERASWGVSESGAKDERMTAKSLAAVKPHHQDASCVNRDRRDWRENRDKSVQPHRFPSLSLTSDMVRRTEASRTGLRRLPNRRAAFRADAADIAGQVVTTADAVTEPDSRSPHEDSSGQVANRQHERHRKWHEVGADVLGKD